MVEGAVLDKGVKTCHYLVLSREQLPHYPAQAF